MKIQPRDVEMVVAAALHFKEVTADELADVLTRVLDHKVSDLDVYGFINQLKFHPQKPRPGHEGSSYFERWEALLPHPTNESDRIKLADIETSFDELLEQAHDAHRKKMRNDKKFKQHMRNHAKKERELVGDLKLEDLARGKTLVEQMKFLGIFAKSMTHFRDHPTLAMLRRPLRLDGGFLSGPHYLREGYLEDSRCGEALDDGPNVEGWIDTLPVPSPGGTKGVSKGKYKALENVKVESECQGKEVPRVEKKGKGKELVKVEDKPKGNIGFR